MSKDEKDGLRLTLRVPRKPLDDDTDVEAWFGEEVLRFSDIRNLPPPHDGGPVYMFIGTMPADTDEWVPVLVLDKGAQHVIRYEMHVWDVMSICAIRGCAQCRTALDVPDGTRLIWAH